MSNDGTDKPTNEWAALPLERIAKGLADSLVLLGRIGAALEDMADRDRCTQQKQSETGWSRCRRRHAHEGACFFVPARKESAP